jgi:hypothetical protein|tara:strand:+ start:248 stop:577 length:330 start_codon:yes stop_codon:yes gene_type:complete
MILLTIGLSLSICAIGVLYYLNTQLKKRLENNNKALLALHQEFTQYQVDNDKRTRDDITTREIRFDRIAKSIQKNEDTIYGVNKKLPENIMRIVSQIEFGKPLNKKTNI